MEKLNFMTFKKSGILAFVSILSFVSCSDDDNTKDGIYDASKPVVFSEFSPSKGGSTTQMIITGENFGNDTSLVKVKVGNVYAKVVGVKPNKIYAMVKARSVDKTGDTKVSVSVSDQKHEFKEPFYYELKQMVSTYAGTGQNAADGNVGTIDGDASIATFADITSFCMDKEGNLFVSEENNSIRKISVDKQVSTLFTQRDWRKRELAFNLKQDTMYMARDVWDLGAPCLYTLKAEDNFSIARGLNTGNTICCNTVSVNPVDGYVFWNQYTNGTIYYSSPEKVGERHEKTSGFNEDADWEVRVCWSQDGKTFYRALVNRHVIYKRSYDPVKHEFVGEEQLFVGQHWQAGYVDGIGTNARINRPCQCVTDDQGNLYIADSNNHCIRKVTPDGNVTLYAGTRERGLLNGLPLKSQFNNPEALCIDANGTLYVGERDNHTIRKIVVE